MRRSLVVTLALLSVASAVSGTVQSVHALRLRDYDDFGPICRVDTTRSAVALTFDDGPDPRYTDDILRLLAAYQVKATFFVVGERAATRPSELEAVLAGGNEIGNHTWSHARLSDLSELDALEEVYEAGDLLSRFGGSGLVRAPYGDIRADTLRDLWSEGLTPVHWSIPLDRYAGDQGFTPADAAQAIAAEVHPGDVILAHDAADGGIDRDRAVSVLRLLLPLLTARGIEVTTVGDLLRSGAPVAAVPRPWIWQSGFSCPEA